jgi:hypothetical protein
MRLKNVLTITLILVVAAGEVRSQTKMTIGVGATASCGKWLSRRASGNWFDIGNWALGFMSGVAIYSDDLNPLIKVDSDAVAYWLDNYCSAHPTASFVDAIKVFINTRAGERPTQFGR